MPDFLKILLVICILASVVFALAKAPACASAFAPSDFIRRRNLWFSVTLAVFLANNYWIYIFVVGTLLFFAVQKEKDKLALFFFLLFAVPPIPKEIGGLGIINFFFSIDYPRLLALIVLLPAYLLLRKQGGGETFGRNLPDKFLIAYLMVQLALMLPVSSLTNAVRVGIFYPFLGVFLPYYVASRATRNLQDFRGAMMAFAVAVLLISAVGLFENLRHWPLYNSLQDLLGASGKWNRNLERGSELRAQATTGQPIVLGYVVAVGFGFFLYLRRLIPGRMRWLLGMCLLLGGLYAPVSRGPWVGAAAIALLFVATGQNPVRRLVRLGLMGAAAMAAILMTPFGEKLLDYLPWMGTAETKTIDFRAQLLEQSISVILSNPFFGGYDYLDSFQDLATGTGFVDIVNTYVGIALAQGLVGLFLFLSVFISVILGIFKSMRKLPDMNDERYLLGQALLATLVGILVTIGTVSSITFVPIIYWSVIGLGLGYVRMLDLEHCADKVSLNEADRPSGVTRGSPSSKRRVPAADRLNLSLEHFQKLRLPRERV